MIGLSLFRRRGGPAGFLPALALALAALSPQGNAADKPKEPNVIVDDSVLDSLGPGTTGADLPLPAPAQAPLSRLLQPGEAAVNSQTPPTVAPDATVPAAPTTPIQATEIGAANTSAVTNGTTNADGTTAAPAAGASSQTAAASAAPPAKDGATDQTVAKPPIEGMVRIPFDPESTALSDPAKTAMAPLVEKLNADFSLRVQVLAYAAGNEQSSTHARGVSLGRALAIRGYLSEQGIAMGRMDLRALGNSAQEQPADRVDLIPTAQ